MTETKPYILMDSKGAMRVGIAGVELDGIVAAFEIGESPESIQRQYPALLLEEVYGAIAHYLGHREEVTDYPKRQDEVWKMWRSKLELNPDPLIERLKKVRESGARQAL